MMTTGFEHWDSRLDNAPLTCEELATAFGLSITNKKIRSLIA